MKLRDGARLVRGAVLITLCWALAPNVGAGSEAATETGAEARAPGGRDAGGGSEAAELLDWVDLMPADWEPEMPDLSSFFHDPQGAGFSQDVSAPVVEALDGRRVSIEGWLVPLDQGPERFREFLLVPYFGACIHVPPPPTNQIVHVRVDAGLTEKEMWDPQRVTGTLRVEGAVTDLAQAGYRMERASAQIVEW